MKKLFVLAIWFSTMFTAYSQNDFEAFKNMSIGLKASPFLGYGLEAATGLNDHFILRLGVNLTKGISAGYFNFDLDEKEEVIDHFGYMPALHTKPTLEFVHGNLLLDIHPGGIFHVTVGAFAGQSKAIINGYLVDSNNNRAELLPGKTWPSVDIGDQIVDTTNGTASGYCQIGNTIKPYFGLGFGRAVAKNKRLALKFELGALYQGDKYKVHMNGKDINLANASEQSFRDVYDLINDHWYSKFWPQMNFQLSYRIF
jgi:hypothetical protein